jgi:hypothetical protein
MSPQPNDVRDHLAMLDMMDAWSLAEQLGRGEIEADDHAMRVIETGLVTTYMRPFTGRHPLNAAEVVPEEHRQFHLSLKVRRNKLAAHTDADAPQEIRREVTESFPDFGGRMLESGQPATLTTAELEQLAELARAVFERLMARGRDPGSYRIAHVSLTIPAGEAVQINLRRP